MSTTTEERFEGKLAMCERAWQAGNFPVLIDAIILCARYGRPPPQWATIANLEVLIERYEGITRKKRGRIGSVPKNEYRQRQIHYERWDAVRELRDRKAELKDVGCEPTWDAVYENASRILKCTYAAGSPDVIKRSYQMVQRAMKEGQGSLYCMSESGERLLKWGKKTR